MTSLTTRLWVFETVSIRISFYKNQNIEPTDRARNNLYFFFFVFGRGARCSRGDGTICPLRFPPSLSIALALIIQIRVHYTQSCRYGRRLDGNPRPAVLRAHYRRRKRTRNTVAADSEFTTRQKGKIVRPERKSTKVRNALSPSAGCRRILCGTFADSHAFRERLGALAGFRCVFVVFRKTFPPPSPIGLLVTPRVRPSVKK